jgi:hypothetical protein
MAISTPKISSLCLAQNNTQENNISITITIIIIIIIIIIKTKAARKMGMPTVST